MPTRSFTTHPGSFPDDQGRDVLGEVAMLNDLLQGRAR